jgi:hypothetical protein
VTDQEKNIYNTYLATTRSRQNKPFKIRKDFEDLKDKQLVTRLTNFFKRYPHIKPYDFFTAPYEIYPDTAHLELSYFLTRAAIKVYSLYQQKLKDVSPDLQIEDIRKSLQYIGSFCLKNKIQLEDYLTHKTGCIYTWMMHYREHYVNIYSLFEVGDISSFLTKVSNEEKKIFVDDLQKTIGVFKIRYHNSATTKALVKSGTEKIKKFLKESLNVSQNNR